MNIGILEYDEKIAYQLEEIAREHQIAPDVVFTCQGGTFPLKVTDGESSEDYPQAQLIPYSDIFLAYLELVRKPL